MVAFLQTFRRCDIVPGSTYFHLFAMFFGKKPQPEASQDVPVPATDGTPPVQAPRPNFSEAASPVAQDDIFVGLGQDFFNEAIEPSKERKKKDPLEMGALVSGILAKLLFVALVVSGVDASVRNLENAEALSALPVCSYLSIGLDDYQAGEDECKTVRQIAAEKTAERDSMESTIVANLLVIVPRKIEALDVVGSPEIQFIKSKTGDSRVPLAKMIEDFIALTKKTDLQGEDVECSNFTMDEKGNMTTHCEFFGDALLSSSQESNTSRMVAIRFMKILSGSDFRIVNPPKVLPIQKYDSAEAGIRSTFSTVTGVDFQLQYTPNNGLRR